MAVEAINDLLQESREVTSTLNAHNDGAEELSLKKIESTLRRGENLRDELDLSIDSYGRTQDTLFQTREKLDRALSQGSLEFDDQEDCAYEAAGNPFGLFGSSQASVRSDVQVDEFGLDADFGR